MRKYCRRGEIRKKKGEIQVSMKHIQLREVERLKVEAYIVIFIEEKAALETLNQLNSRFRVSNINLIPFLGQTRN